MRLDIAYDGTDFSGWARQNGLRTVCGEIEEKLGAVLRTPLQLTVAGRTDAGVHATGQVAHVDVPLDTVPDDPSRLVRRLARFLPKDVRIKQIAFAPEHFDARFSAMRRHYEYRLTSAAYGADPLRARDTVSYPKVLDLELMRAASATLLGLHDFAAFCKRREGATTVRDLQRFDWERDGDVFTAFVSADAFCWSMVRSLVGAVLAVGRDVATSTGSKDSSARSRGRVRSWWPRRTDCLWCASTTRTTRIWRHATRSPGTSGPCRAAAAATDHNRGVDRRRGCGGASTYDGSGREGACS